MEASTPSQTYKANRRRATSTCGVAWAYGRSAVVNMGLGGEAAEGTVSHTRGWKGTIAKSSAVPGEYHTIVNSSLSPQRATHMRIDHTSVPSAPAEEKPSAGAVEATKEEPIVAGGSTKPSKS